MSKGLFWIGFAYMATMILLAVVTWLLVSINTSYSYIGFLLMAVDSIIFITFMIMYKDNYYNYRESMCLILKLFEELEKKN